MKKTFILLVFILAICMFALFQIKYKVQNLKKDLIEINRQIAYNHDSVNILKAEWAYLNNPARLEKLAEKFLDIKPTESAQIYQYQDISLALLENDPNNAIAFVPIMKPILSSSSQ